ncbi:MAG: zinc-binding dehydrogenase [Gammaproteobacteria bacterium]|nr:zinc-binding dehydrogenase [Gammaproteobacteria bacterium]
MKAIYLQSHGNPDSVVIGEQPTPEPGADEVRVRIHASALNHVDLYMRDSGLGITHDLPLIMGVDGAGVVDAVGSDVTGWQPGDRVVIYPARVCQRCEFCRRGEQMLCLECKIPGEHIHGCFADFICVTSDMLFPLPDEISFEDAAVLPTAYLTAWRMVMTQARIRPTETVLIHGVGGGVALAALQFVRLAGAQAIVTSSSTDKLETALELGAQAGINYREQDVVEEVMRLTGNRGVDAVVDNVGMATWSLSLRAVRRSGRIVTCGATTGPQPKADLQRVFIRQLQITGSTLGTQDEFRSLLLAAEQHQFTPAIERVYRFEEVLDALEHLHQGRQFGKLVLQVAS